MSDKSNPTGGRPGSSIERKGGYPAAKPASPAARPTAAFSSRPAPQAAPTSSSAQQPR